MNYIFSSVAGDSLTLSSTMAILGSALIMGLLISLVYIYTHKESGYASSFATTLIMLPAIISTIILLVGSNEGCFLRILHRGRRACLRHGLSHRCASLCRDSLSHHACTGVLPLRKAEIGSHDLKDRDPGGSEL